MTFQPVAAHHEGMNFTDENPYQSPSVIRAELVEAPKPPAKKRHPLLAIVFLVCGLPFMLLGSYVCFWVCFLAATRPQEQSNPLIVLLGLSLVILFTAACWIVPVLSVRELVQHARGR